MSQYSIGLHSGVVVAQDMRFAGLTRAACEGLRDAFAESNPQRIGPGVYCLLEPAGAAVIAQKRNGSSWIDQAFVVAGPEGPPGPTGEITYDAVIPAPAPGTSTEFPLYSKDLSSVIGRITNTAGTISLHLVQVTGGDKFNLAFVGAGGITATSPNAPAGYSHTISADMQEGVPINVTCTLKFFGLEMSFDVVRIGSDIYITKITAGLSAAAFLVVSKTERDLYRASGGSSTKFFLDSGTRKTMVWLAASKAYMRYAGQSEPSDSFQFDPVDGAVHVSTETLIRYVYNAAEDLWDYDVVPNNRLVKVGGAGSMFRVQADYDRAFSDTGNGVDGGGMVVYVSNNFGVGQVCRWIATGEAGGGYPGAGEIWTSPDGVTIKKRVAWAKDGRNVIEEADIPTGASLTNNGFTKLGVSAPAIKMLTVAGVMPAVGTASSHASGVAMNKILGVDVLVVNNGGVKVPPSNGITTATNYYTFYVGSTGMLVVTTGSGGTAIAGMDFKALITYEA